MTIPGDTLLETIRSMRISQTLLARMMGRPVKTINEIIKGKTQITVRTAIELEDVLAIPAQFWLTLEMHYRLALARGPKKLR